MEAHIVTKRRGLKKAGLYVGLACGALFSGFPVIWMVFASFKSNTEIFSLPPQLLPKVFSLEAYRSIFSSASKVRFFINSYFVAITVTLMTLLFAILAAYSFSRYTFRGKKQLNLFIISTQSLPPITLLIPYFGLIASLRLYDTYFALIFTYMVFTLPYAILMMTGYFNTLPRELDEAVLIDGAGNFKALWHVLVPISAPGIVSTGLYTFIICWNEYLFALTLTKTTAMRTVPVGIQQLMGQHSYEWNEMMAMSVLGCLPILILFLFFQRHFIAGMTAGSVKS